MQAKDAAKPRVDYEALERLLGYRFLNRTFLRTALTSDSIVFEIPEDAKNKNYKLRHKHHYDVLENFGDGAMALAVRCLLGERYPDYPVGERVRMEHLITCNANLAHLAFRMKLWEWIRISSGHPVYTKKLLADVVEALLGAVFKDAADAAAQDLDDPRVCYGKGFSEVVRVSRKLFEVDMELVQVDMPFQRLQTEVKKRWGEEASLRYFQRKFAGRFVGAACKLIFQKRTSEQIGAKSITATGYTPEGAMQNAGALAMLYLAPKWYPHRLPKLSAFSWRIKAATPPTPDEIEKGPKE